MLKTLSHRPQLRLEGRPLSYLINTLDWAWRVLILVGLVWTLVDLVHAALFVSTTWGLAALPFDSVVQSRLGGALIALPLLSVATLGGKRVRVQQVANARWTTGCLVAGMALNGLAWFDLQRRVPWAAWAFVLIVWGLLGLGLLGAWARKPPRASGLVVGVVFLGLYTLYSLFNLITLGYMVAPFPAEPPRPAATRDDRWRQDLAYLATELPRLHLNAYHTVPPAAFQAAVADLNAAIPTLDDAGVQAALTRLVARVGDAHTNLEPWPPTRTYPLRLAWFPDGLYVVQASSAYPQALGGRVTRIGRLSMDEAYQAVRPLIAHENEAWEREQSPRFLTTPDVLAALDIVADPQAAPFTLVDPSGQTVELTLAPLARGERIVWTPASDRRPLYRQHPDQNFWFQYLPDTATLYFRYNACTDPLGFSRSVKEFLALADQTQPARVVVDLRNNSGGNSMQFSLLRDGLTARPRLVQRGRLFILVNGGTFSSGVDAAVELRQATDALVVGQPTGGAPNSYGDVRSFRLPNSGLTVRYSVKYFKLQANDTPTLEPDVPIAFAFADYLAGRDPVLEWVLNSGTDRRE